MKHPLGCLGLLGPAQVEQLKEHWITTVEELLCAVASDAARQSLAELLSMSHEDMVDLVARAKELLGPDRAEELMTQEPREATGLLLTDEQRRKLGLE